MSAMDENHKVAVLHNWLAAGAIPTPTLAAALDTTPDALMAVARDPYLPVGLRNWAPHDADRVVVFITGLARENPASFARLLVALPEPGSERLQATMALRALMALDRWWA